MTGNIGLALLYFGLAHLSLQFATLPGNVTAVWLPAGVALAASLTYGAQVLPGIALGSFASATVDLATTMPGLSWGRILLTSLFIAANSVLDPVLFRWLLPNWLRLGQIFNQVRSVSRFILAGIMAPMVTASLGTAILYGVGLTTQSQAGLTFMTWWLATFLSYLIVTPALLAWKQTELRMHRQYLEAHKVELGLLWVLTLSTCFIAFGTVYNVEYLLLPLLIWAVIRSGKRNAMLMVVVVGAIALGFASQGLEPFAPVEQSTSQGVPLNTLLLLQSYVGVMALLALVLSALIHEREVAQDELQQTLETLEGRVQERTAALIKSNRQLAIAKIEAEGASQAKSAFVASVSHELRTPLNAILGIAQVLMRSKTLSADQQDNLHIIQRNGEHLLSLVNQVLDLSKIEAGKMTLTERHFDLKELLGEIQSLAQYRAQGKAIALIFQFAEDLPQSVYGDDTKLRQILLNLMDNAIKFTETGYVKLRVQTALFLDNSTNFATNHAADSSVMSDQALYIEIEDTGSGIDAGELEQLFNAFSQTQSGLATQEGTGLGLTISQNFVHLMGGEIKVTSTVNLGTTFSIHLPIPAGVGVTSSEKVPTFPPPTDNADRLELEKIWEMPEEWLSNMWQAAIALDDDQITHLIGQLPANQGRLAQLLLKQVSLYRVDYIATLIESRPV